MSEQNEVRPEKQTVFFVKEGQMYSSWIIGHVDINVSVEVSETYVEAPEVLKKVLAKDCETIAEYGEHTKAIQRHVRVDSFIARPGRWYYLSGMRVVHADDCYATREDAAKAEYERLLTKSW